MLANLLMAVAAWTLGSVVLGTILGGVIDFGGHRRLPVSQGGGATAQESRLIRTVLPTPKSVISNLSSTIVLKAANRRA